MSAGRIKELVESAHRSAGVGRWDEAERQWREVLKLSPQHPAALYALGLHALTRGDLGGAHELLATARAVAPRDINVLMALANVARRRGDREAEREAFTAALAVDAYFIPALLAKAAWFEQGGDALNAAATYRNVLRIAPPEAQWPEQYRPQLQHARLVVDGYAERFAAHLTERLGPHESGLPPATAERWREAASIMAGRSAPYVSNSNQLHVPRLPAVPFFDRATFAGIAALEAKTDVIRAELLAALQADRDRFTPYIQYRPGDPVNQWRELNHSLRWSALHLWQSGRPVPENLERCPETARALAALGMVEIEGLCPNAMFSVLAPHTHIPPHHGETNARVIGHLPLIVPEGCTYRVGFERRRWRVGEALIFDDTLEHEARNDSDEVRVVLIFDLWNPLLTAAERALVQAMAAAAREFRG